MIDLYPAHLSGDWILQLDEELWNEALEYCMFLDSSAMANRPILGMPVSLCRLIARIARFYHGHLTPDLLGFAAFQDEMRDWETRLPGLSISDVEAPYSNLIPIASDPCQCTTMIYVLAASILLERINTVPDAADLNASRANSRFSQRREHEDNDSYMMCTPSVKGGDSRGVQKITGVVWLADRHFLGYLSSSCLPMMFKGAPPSDMRVMPYCDNPA